jgi:hypothetical protein
MTPAIVFLAPNGLPSFTYLPLPPLFVMGFTFRQRLGIVRQYANVVETAQACRLLVGDITTLIIPRHMRVKRKATRT